jgi:hypothetical protein
MSPDRKKPGVAFWATVVVVVVLVAVSAYVGAYALMVTPGPGYLVGPDMHHRQHPAYYDLSFAGLSSHQHEALGRFFAPVNSIDRTFRQDVWTLK